MARRYQRDGAPSGTQGSWTTTSAQILNSHVNKTKWRVTPKRKTGAAAKHLLIEPLNQTPQIAQENGLLPADARQQINQLVLLPNGLIHTATSSYD